MILKSVKTFLSGLDGSIRLVGAAVNLSLVLGFGWATIQLYSKTIHAWSNIGPIPSLSIPSLTAWASEPDAIDKLVSMGSLWVYAILAIGCGWMTALGLRWFYHFLLAIIQQLKLQTDKALA